MIYMKLSRPKLCLFRHFHAQLYGGSHLSGSLITRSHTHCQISSKIAFSSISAIKPLHLTHSHHNSVSKLSYSHSIFTQSLNPITTRKVSLSRRLTMAASSSNSDSLSESTISLQIVSHNMLSQVNFLPKYFAHVDTRSRVNKWSVRSKMLIDTWLATNDTEDEATIPDVLCIQEMDMFDQCNEALTQHGYRGVYAPMRKDGLALFYNAQTLKIVRHRVIEYPQRGAIVAALQPIQHRNVAPIVVACTHLYWQDMHGLHLESIDILHKALAAMQGEMQSIAKAPCSVIVCGDFNTTPDSKVYRAMTARQSNSSSDDLKAVPDSLSTQGKTNKTTKKSKKRKKKHGTASVSVAADSKSACNSIDRLFTSAYANHRGTHKEPYYTTFVPTRKETIDYVFYTSPNKRLELQRIEDLPDFKGSDDFIPNDVHPSDHLPLRCWFRYTC
jgi:mRNA deadenylase 3'-5' endonuclease subunit Ccr4